MASQFSDLALAWRLERAEAASNAAFVEARALSSPGSGARWIEVAGACAMFDGPTSPLTQTFGLGLFEPAREDVLVALESFFVDAGADVFHEVSPLAGPELAALLAGRGYLPVEFTNVLYRPVGRSAVGTACSDTPATTEGARGAAGAQITVRRAVSSDEEAWTEAARRGWGHVPELAGFLSGVGRVGFRASGSFPFLAEMNGQPIAAGSLSIHGGVAVLAGASTIPEARGRGAQPALLDARLCFAADRGCDLAMMCALPGSASQRNAERNAFRIAYTRTKWHLPQSGVRS